MLATGAVTPELRQPTYRLVWPGDDTFALEALDFADAIGLRPDPWQAQTLTDWMLTNREYTDHGNVDKWSHRSCCLIVPRQSGKTWACSVRLLFALFFRPGGEQNILYSAHRFQSATAQFRELVRLIDNNPELRKRVKRLTSSTGNEMIETKSGAALFVQSRTNTITSQTRGRAFDLVFLDEALVLYQTYMASMLPTLSSRPNPQIIYSSSGGDHDSEVLSKVRQAGYDRSPGLTLSEYAASPDDDPDDEQTVIKSNPGYPVRPTPDAVHQERVTLTRSEFARERLGIWSTGAPEPAIQPEAFNAIVDAHVGHPPIGHAIMAADVSGRDGTRSGALAVAWRDPTDQMIRAVLVASGNIGNGWLPKKVTEIAASHDIYQLVMVPGNAVDVADSMPPEVEVTRKPFGYLQASCARLNELVQTAPHDVLRVQHSTVLTDTLKVGKQTSANGAWVFSSKYIPAAPLNALALAVTAIESGDNHSEANIW